MQIDHVVLAVRDLDEAGARLLQRTGLASVPGGRHLRWGTANRIVPLGADYVELIAVVDLEVGAATELGRMLLTLTEDGRDRWFAVCLRDPDIGATAARLGLGIEAGSRTRPDGVELRWRGAGIEDPARAAWLPFFILWDVAPEQHPGRMPVEHRVRPTGIERIDVVGDAAVMREWLGDAKVPIGVRDGQAPRVRSVTVGLAEGESIVIEGGV